MGDLAVVDQAKVNALAAVLGASQQSSSAGGNSDRLPMLKISSDEDAQGRETKPGMFYVAGTGEDAVYAKTVKVRPLSQLFQWIQYDPEENKVANKTLMIPDFKQEPRDMKGGLRCGKPVSKVLRELSKEEQNKYKDITCFRQVRALVSYEGTTVDGDKKTIENLPVILMLKGSNFNPFEDEYVKVLPRGKNLYDYWANVSTEKRRNGSVTYFVMHFEPDLSSPAVVDPDTYDTLLHIAEMVKNENTMINNAYQKSVREAQIDDDVLDALEADLSEDLEDVA